MKDLDLEDIDLENIGEYSDEQLADIVDTYQWDENGYGREAWSEAASEVRRRKIMRETEQEELEMKLMEEERRRQNEEDNRLLDEEFDRQMDKDD